MNTAYPEPIAGALIVNDKKEVFLMKSHKWGGKYQIPGGHVELGEKLTDAVIRELHEETGLTVKPLGLINIRESIFEPQFYQKKHMIFFNFLCKVISGTVKLDQREGQEYVWIKPEEALKALNLEFHTEKTIKEYISKQTDLIHL